MACAPLCTVLHFARPLKALVCATDRFKCLTTLWTNSPTNTMHEYYAEWLKIVFCVLDIFNFNMTYALFCLVYKGILFSLIKRDKKHTVFCSLSDKQLKECLTFIFFSSTHIVKKKKEKKELWETSVVNPESWLVPYLEFSESLHPYQFPAASDNRVSILGKQV